MSYEQIDAKIAEMKREMRELSEREVGHGEALYYLLCLLELMAECSIRIIDHIHTGGGFAGDKGKGG